MCAVVKRLVLIVLVVLSAALNVAAKDWRGILPMHSTREQVEGLLGPPPPPPKDRGYTLHERLSIYFFDEEEVYIFYAEAESVGRECLSNVPAGTVLMIHVTPKGGLPLASLNLDVKQFRKFDASDPASKDYEGFVSEQEGFALRAFEGSVQEMLYVASAADRAHCPGYYANFESRLRVRLQPGCGLLSKFDEYGDLSFSDEKARLDNFGIQLSNDENKRGHIIVYAGRKAMVAEAQVRGNRAMDYLISVRKINPERITAIDGGHHEDLTIQLYILPKDIDPKSLVSPTVDPSEVQIIYEKKRRSKKRN